MKKGQSQILVNILLVLVAIAAIVFVAIFINNQIKQANEETDVRIEVAAGVYNLDIAAALINRTDNKTLLVKVYRNGARDEAINSLIFTLLDKAGKYYSYTDTQTAQTHRNLETKDYVIYSNNVSGLVDFSQIVYFEVAVGVKSSSGNVIVTTVIDSYGFNPLNNDGNTLQIFNDNVGYNLTIVNQTEGSNPIIPLATKNNITEAGEACDGTDVNGYTCATVAAGFKSGVLRCNENRMSYDVSGCVVGTVWNAASCSQVDVQNAINSASDGDIVVVPNGTCVWSNPVYFDMQSLELDYLTIKGSGNTIITSSQGAFDIVGKLGKGFRITNFIFYNNTGNEIININGDSNNWRVDHNIFNYTSSTRRITVGADLNGKGLLSYGVVDNNLFYKGTGIAVHIRAPGIGPGGHNGGNLAWNNWKSLGTVDSIFIENNIFNHDTLDSLNCVTDAEYGGGFVVRNNNITNTKICMHDDATGGRGTLSWEVYNNNFIQTSDITYASRPIGIRSGSGVMYKNNFTSLGSNPYSQKGNSFIGPIIITHYSICDDTHNSPWNFYCNGSSHKFCLGTQSYVKSCNSDADCNNEVGACKEFNTLGGTGYPCRDQVGVGNNLEPRPALFWGNKRNGVYEPIVVYDVGTRPGCNQNTGTFVATNYIVKDRDYCTNLNDSMPSSCNGINTDYIPYPYPHPLSLIEPTITQQIISQTPFQIYIANASSGSDNGYNCANAYSVAWFNNASNWNALVNGTDNKIGPNDIVHLCGVISTNLTIKGSGSFGKPITIYFEKDAKMSAPYWNTYSPNQISGSDRGFPISGAITGSNKDNLIIDGGVNGIIEATQLGTNFIYNYSNAGIYCSGRCSNFEIENLKILNMYNRTRNTPDFRSYGVSIYLTGGSNVSIHNSYLENAFYCLSYGNGGFNASNIEIYNNTIVGCDVGISAVMGTLGTNLNNVKIHHNSITKNNVWDGTITYNPHDPSTNYHRRDGIKIWGSESLASVYSNLKIYNNVIGPDIYGNMFGTPTGYIVASNGQYVGFEIYNNILISGFADTTSPIIAIGGTRLVNTTFAPKVYKNTLIGIKAQHSLLQLGYNWGQTQDGPEIYDNIFYNFSMSGGILNTVDIRSNISYWDNNSWYPIYSAQPQSSWVYHGAYYNWSQWKNALGFDANSQTTNPMFVNILNPAGPDGIFWTDDDGLRLMSNSPAIKSGRYGQDIGAYEYS